MVSINSQFELFSTITELTTFFVIIKAIMQSIEFSRSSFLLSDTYIITAHFLRNEIPKFECPPMTEQNPCHPTSEGSLQKTISERNIPVMNSFAYLFNVYMSTNSTIIHKNASSLPILTAPLNLRAVLNFTTNPCLLLLLQDFALPIKYECTLTH